MRLDSFVAGSRSGTLSFRTNDSDENPFNFTIRGNVQNPTQPPSAPNPPAPATPAAPGIAVYQVRNGKSFLVSDGSAIDFGTVLKDSSAVRNFQIFNRGKATLTLSSLSVPGGFRLVTPPGLTIAPGGNTRFALAMHTSIVANRSGTFSFITNDPKIGTFNFAMTGNIVAPSAPQAPNPPSPPPPPPPPPSTPPRHPVSHSSPPVN